MPLKLNIEPDDGSSLSEDELMVNFLVVKPQHPEEEVSLKAFRVPRRLLASEEFSKAVVPQMLSLTTIPQIFHHCSAFIKAVSEYVGSLPSDTRTVHVYHVIVDGLETPPSLWIYYFMSEELSSTDEVIYLALEHLDCEDLKKVKIEDPLECVICLEDLLAGTEAAMLPCSHVYHRGCIINWLFESDNCPLCRFRVLNDGES